MKNGETKSRKKGKRRLIRIVLTSIFHRYVLAIS